MRSPPTAGAFQIVSEPGRGVIEAIAEAPIFPCEDIRSEPMAAIGEAVPRCEGHGHARRIGRCADSGGSNAPTEGRRTRKKKRWQKDVSLRPGERWKRRLPWVLRHNRAAR